MKRYRLAVIIFAVLGLALVTGCGDSGGGGGGLPKSASLYEGPGMPAVIDSTTSMEFWDIPRYIYNEVFFFSEMSSSLAYTFSDVGEDEFQGDISGSYINWWDGEGYASTTEEWERYKWGRTYNDYRNSTDILHGEGKFYDSYYSKRTTDGVILNGLALLSVGAIGNPLTAEYSCHCNNSAYLESTVSTATSRGGWMTQSGHSTYDTSNGTVTWSHTGKANYGENDLASQKYWAILDGTSNVAYDGSQTTFTASGTYCREGIGWPFEGCVDFDYDLTFDCETPWVCAPTGTQNVSNETVSAKFTFDGAWCFDYDVDVGKDGTVDFTGNFCD